MQPSQPSRPGEQIQRTFACLSKPLITIVFLCMSALPLSAAESAGTDPANAIRQHLLAADAARRTAADEAGAWATEKQRIEAAIAALKADTQHLSTEAKELEEELANDPFTRADEELARQREGIEALSSMLTQKVRTALQQLDKQLPRFAAADIASLQQLPDAVAALQNLEQQLLTIDESIVRGTIAGSDEEIGVRLLHVGTAALWWLSLDNERAGVATIKNGQIILQPADAVALKNITLAIAMRRHDHEASPIDLPLALPAQSVAGGQP